MTDEQDALLSCAETAKLLKVHTQTLRVWRSKETGPPYTRIQGRVMYPRSWLSAWLKEQANVPA